MELSNETFLHGEKYRILYKISQGNFGITYLAEQTSLDRKVCIKEFFFRGSCERSVNGQVTVTTSGQDVTNSFRRKFMREAKRLSQFDHPNIVKVIDVFEENGTAYMVMDYVEGETLQRLVDRKGKLTEKEALGYIIPLCDALEVVHEKNLLHLDIKPSNILIKRQTNTPVLIDFGISKFTEASGEDHSTTTPVALTKGYAPLEQYGQDLAKLTASTDVYSVAATLYKLVTGVTPPEAAVIVQEGIKPPREINTSLSEQLNSIILQSLSVKPSQRALSISKLKADLKGIFKREVVEKTESDTEVLVEIKEPVPIVISVPDKPRNRLLLRWRTILTLLNIGIPLSIVYQPMNMVATLINPDLVNSMFYNLCWGVVIFIFVLNCILLYFNYKAKLQKIVLLLNIGYVIGLIFLPLNVYSAGLEQFNSFSDEYNLFAVCLIILNILFLISVRIKFYLHNN